MNCTRRPPPQCKARKLTIASVATLMVQVIAGARRSLFVAFTADQASPASIITASYQAVYGRIGRMAPEFSCAVTGEKGRDSFATKSPDPVV